MTNSQTERERLVQEGKITVIDWMILSGASFNEENIELREDIDEFELEGMQYFLGPSTCDAANGIVIDKENSWDDSKRSPHHDFEIGALAVLGSVFDRDTLESMITNLYPNEHEEIAPENQEQYLIPLGICWPLGIEVGGDDNSVDVWVVQRFRVGDFTLPDFQEKMSRFVELSKTVRSTCLS
jgi:hypothetical protein